MRILPAIYLFGTLCLASAVGAQTLDPSRKANWTLAGFNEPHPAVAQTISILDHGGDASGERNNDEAISKALAALGGNPGVIYFPAGNFRFSKRIRMSSGVIFRGASAASTTLTLAMAEPTNGIDLHGRLGKASTAVTGNLTKDQQQITVADASPFTAGQYLRLTSNDAALVTSSWAEGCTGQVVRIKAIEGNRMTLESPLRRNYQIANKPMVRAIEPITHAGIENLKIERADKTKKSTRNIQLYLAANCWVSCVESSSCNFGHIEVNYSTNCVVYGNYLHHAFSYGEGGKAYGIVLSGMAGENRIENNILEHLRHSILLQTGANGNVVGYNYSIDPYWDQGFFLPSNSAGDLVLHGNYPYANLFEGNVVQNIVIDDSHGKNGPHNTFLRNDAQLYGIFMNASPASDQQNFLGNEISDKGGFFTGLYILSGSGHALFGNNHQGKITPSGTKALEDISFYLNERPAFYENQAWPAIGPETALGNSMIEAVSRKRNGTLTVCAVKPEQQDKADAQAEPPHITIHPNLTKEQMNLLRNGGKRLGSIELTDKSGKLIQTASSFRDLNTADLAAGTYQLKVLTATGTVLTERLLMVH